MELPHVGLLSLSRITSLYLAAKKRERVVLIIRTLPDKPHALCTYGSGAPLLAQLDHELRLHADVRGPRQEAPRSLGACPSLTLPEIT